MFSRLEKFDGPIFEVAYIWQGGGGGYIWSVNWVRYLGGGGVYLRGFIYGGILTGSYSISWHI